MKNTIIAWHAQKNESNFPRQSRIINDAYELWESCRFDDVVEKLEKSQVSILMVAADQQNQEVTQRLQQIGASHPKLQVIALFNSQCSTQALEQLCHMLYNTQDIKQPAAHSLIAALTKRQQQVLDLISKGCSNKQIADKLHMSEGTVKIHCMAIFRGLGVNNRTQAAMLATGAT